MNTGVFFEDYQKCKPLKQMYVFILFSKISIFKLQTSSMIVLEFIIFENILYTFPLMEFHFQFGKTYYEHAPLSPIRLVVECHCLISPPPAGRLLVKLLVAWKKFHFKEEFSSCTGRCPK